MKRSEAKRTIDRYTRQLKRHGFGPKALGWSNGRQNLRFRVLMSQWKVRGARVLDVGCGFGDLYGYCQKRGIKIHYTGIDMNPALIEEGRKHYPKARLLVRNFYAEGLKGRFDYIFCSGVFNFRLERNERFIRRAFRLFSRHAKKGFAVNFLSNRVDYRLRHAYHADPAHIVTLAYRHSNRVVLRNDYAPFEFTVFVDKRTAFKRRTAVYREFELFLD
jgi:SAM-dependent methyltransferase